MRVDVLSARVALCKTIRNTIKEPYPNVRDFKSASKDISTIEQLTVVIKDASLKGACLLKGELDRPLDWEPRAGHHQPDKPTSWVCLDLDYLASVATIDDFLVKIASTDVSYILQWSNSYGIHGNFFIRAHLFMLLDRPYAPAVLKNWLKQLNFQAFTSDLALDKLNMRLRWGLDISTCQNDKLLFVAPPICHPTSINQFQGERVVLHKKAQDYLTLPDPLWPSEKLRMMEEAKINELRVAAGLEKRKPLSFRTKDSGGVPYLPNPEHAIVTDDPRINGDWVHLNLNGGDSWAYYHHKDRPEFIYNFKGEPAYKTKELVPEYWYSLQQAKAQAKKQASKGKLILAFCDYRSSKYYRGTYDEATDRVDISMAHSEKQINDYLTQLGQPVPEAIPTWDIVYDPLAGPIDIAAKQVNLFELSQYMKDAQTRSEHKPFPTIDRLCRHVMGAGCITHWYNWLAFVYQFRVTPGTAWVWHGVPGIGKGLIYNHVLRPLLGEKNVTIKRMEELEEKFNGHLETALICFIDEAQVSDSGRHKMIMANIKNQIVEPTITIRNMNRGAYLVTNRVGWIFASNMPDAVVVDPDDRRFNVGEFQPRPITDTDALVKALETELLDFAVFLRLYQVDTQAVREPIRNAARDQLIATSRTSADVIASAILMGQMKVLWDQLPTNEATVGMGQAEQDAYLFYKQLIHAIILEGRDRLTRDELRIIFNFCVGNVSASPQKLASFLRHKRIELKTIRVGTTTPLGIMVDWHDGPTWFADRCAEIQQALAQAPTLKVVK